MKTVTICFLALSAISLWILLTVPYGSDVIHYYGLWPLTFLSVVLITNWHHFKRPKSWNWPGLINGSCCIVILFISMQVIHRNEIYTKEFRGGISVKFRGGHNSPSLRVLSSSGAENAVELLSESDWDGIQIGDEIVKDFGFFYATSGELTISLAEASSFDAFRKGVVAK